ncbi:MAG: Ig-like domain-containing protein [Candidatus Nanohaloarchaea archaeon]|nr:Ig-like domain-containing protein [Candidatus Nanohaloarchaea archaeon]
MRKALAVIAVLVLLGSAGAAITIESPDLSRYTQSQYRNLIVSGASGTVYYSVNGAGNVSCECTVENHPTISPQGSVHLVFYDVGEDGAVATASTEFFADTEPPAVTGRRPAGVLFEQPSHVQADYSDISPIDTDAVQVWLDGDPLNATTTQTGFNASVNLSEGVHTIAYNIPDTHWRSGGDHNATGTWNITLPVEPRLSGAGPGGVTDATPAVTLTARDPSPIATAASYIDIDGPSTVRINLDERPDAVTATEHGISVSAELGELPDGEYTATAHIEDVNGNAAEQQWSFTVDTTPPRISILSHVAGDVVNGEERFAVNLSDLTGIDTATLSVGNQTVTAVRNGDRYTATIDTAQLADGETRATVRATDTAGNTAVRTVNVTVDNHPPSISGLEVYPTTAKGGVLVSATVEDTASQIIGARFRLEGPAYETVTTGRMNAVNGAYNTREESVRRVIDLAQFDVESGEYTVFLTARDAAGHDFTGFGDDFTVDNSANASIQIQEDVFRQEIGTTTTFAVPVANTGDVDELVTASIDTGLDASIDPETRRIGGGETKQFELTVTLPDEQAALGNHSATLTAGGLSTADTEHVEIIGQPHPATREQIRSEVEALVDRLEELNESRHEWDISSDAAQQFTAAAQQVRSVRRLLEEGRYHAAQQELVAAREDLQQTQDTISGEITRAQAGAAASVLAKLLAVLAVAGLVYGGYRLIPEEEGYHPDRGYVHRPEGKHPLRVRVEDWWRRMQAESGETGEDRREKTVDRWEGYGG